MSVIKGMTWELNRGVGTLFSCIIDIIQIARYKEEQDFFENSQALTISRYSFIRSCYIDPFKRVH